MQGGHHVAVKSMTRGFALVYAVALTKASYSAMVLIYIFPFG